MSAAGEQHNSEDVSAREAHKVEEFKMMNSMMSSLDEGERAADARKEKATLHSASLHSQRKRTSPTCSIICACSFCVLAAVTTVLAYALSLSHFGQTGVVAWYYGSREMCESSTASNLAFFDVLNGNDWTCHSWDHYSNTALGELRGFGDCKTAAEVSEVLVLLAAILASLVAVSCLIHCFQHHDCWRRCNVALASASIGALIVDIVCVTTAVANMAVECRDFDGSLTTGTGSEEARGISFVLLIFSILFAIVALVFYCRILRRHANQQHNEALRNSDTTEGVVLPPPKQTTDVKEAEEETLERSQTSERLHDLSSDRKAFNKPTAASPSPEEPEKQLQTLSSSELPPTMPNSSASLSDGDDVEMGVAAQQM